MGLMGVLSTPASFASSAIFVAICLGFEDGSLNADSLVLSVHC
jgi:hypothetical protein